VSPGAGQVGSGQVGTCCAGHRTAPRTVRHVGHVMNLPVSLALRGRHAADEQGRAAFAQAMAELREVDAVFSTYRPDSFVSRLGRGEVTPEDCPPEVAEVLALGELAERQSQGAFRVGRAGPDGEVVLDPTGVVKGWAVERAAGHRGGHLVDARTGRPPAGVASVTVLAVPLTWADIDATAAYAHGRHAAQWLRARTGRGGLVVWADGSTTLAVDGPGPITAPAR
jgi:FAD:protein FMN transferase